MKTQLSRRLRRELGETAAPAVRAVVSSVAPRESTAAPTPEDPPTDLVQQLRRSMQRIDRRYELLSRRRDELRPRERPSLGTPDPYYVPTEIPQEARWLPVRRLPARHWTRPVEDDTQTPPAVASASPPTLQPLAWSPRLGATANHRQPIDDARLLYRQDYALDARFGRLSLAPPVGEPLRRLRQLVGLLLPELPPQEAAELVPRDLLFLDTETTGLSRGAGTIAFMIGVGGFFGPDGGLQVDQIVLDDPAREHEALELLAGYLARTKVLVTFNGASFDLPVLRNRGVLCRLPLDLDRPHIDLLPLSRRLFRPRLPDCRLGTLEREILGFKRQDDIPGAEVPLAYLRYLRGGAMEELFAVLEHNLFDVAGLAALLENVTARFVDPLHWAEDASELLATGLFWRQLDAELAQGCLERALELSEGAGSDRGRRWGALRRRALTELAALHRRSGDTARAGATWDRLRREFPNHERGWVELAKHHEHVTKDLEQALRFAEAAPTQRPEGLQRRLDRLRRRLARDPGGASLR